MNSSTNPWEGLSIPTVAESVLANRIDSELDWLFYWARDPQRHYAWLMSLDADSLPSGPAPQLRGVDVRLSRNEQNGEGLLSMILLDSASRDLFYHLCEDVMSCTATASSEEEAAAMALARTWRWHHLLRGAGSGRLSDEAQKGLVGELEVLREILVPRVGGPVAVHSWLGPLDAPKDFEVGRTAIEVKSRRGTAIPYVTINSESQLDEAGCDALFLIVVEVTPAVASEGLTLTDVVGLTHRAIEESSPAAIEEFEGRLAAAGFRWDDDYSGTGWLVGEHVAYQVQDAFPKIASGEVPVGISSVSYRLSLHSIEHFRVTSETVAESLGES